MRWEHLVSEIFKEEMWLSVGAIKERVDKKTKKTDQGSFIIFGQMARNYKSSLLFYPTLYCKLFNKKNRIRENVFVLCQFGQNHMKTFGLSPLFKEEKWLVQ